MSQNLTRVPGDEIIAEIERSLGAYDRTPFHKQLATAIACGPSRTSWTRLAARSPEKWARALNDLARVSGFADKVEHHHVKHEPAEVAASLVARFGRQKALQMLESVGLPASLIGETIEGRVEIAEARSQSAPETAPAPA